MLASTLIFLRFWFSCKSCQPGNRRCILNSGVAIEDHRDGGLRTLGG